MEERRKGRNFTRNKKWNRWKFWKYNETLWKNIKKDYESNMNIQISDDDNDENDDEMLDIHSHGQRPEY